MAHQHDYHCLVEDGNGGVTCSEGVHVGGASVVRSALRKLNEALHQITLNRYGKHVPLDELYRAARETGFRPKSEEDTPFMLTGHDGKATVEYVHPATPRKTYYLHITWHRMPSGNFETVAYAS